MPIVYTNAHTLKGTAANAGCLRLTEDAKRLMVASKDYGADAER